MNNFIQLAAFSFPDISPVAFSIGPIQVRWYGLGYVVGILFAREYGKYLLKTNDLWNKEVPPIAPQKLDDFLLWAVIGVLLGGRLGEIIFYHPEYYFTHPTQFFALWNGGMSFHGGFLGTTCTIIFFALKNQINILVLCDIVSAGVPVGLGVVRICNFINSELWGRVTDVPWAFSFPNGGTDSSGSLLARHPSQIYEAFLEGIILFLILALLIFRWKKLKSPGFISGSFVLCYGLFRFFIEFFREPDIGYVAGDWLTMGMTLSLPMMFLGFYLIIRTASPIREER